VRVVVPVGSLLTPARPSPMQAGCGARQPNFGGSDAGVRVPSSSWRLRAARIRRGDPSPMICCSPMRKGVGQEWLSPWRAPLVSCWKSSSPDSRRCKHLGLIGAVGKVVGRRILRIHVCYLIKE
jgi:hypothetical protein